MSQDLEWKIEGFLQELLYINPQSLSRRKYNNQVGKISKRVNNFIRDDPMEKRWELFDRSLEKLRTVSKSPNQHEKSTAQFKYISPFVEKELRSTKSRKKIFKQ